MKKSLFIALICLVAILNAQAQHFTHGLGVAFMHDETKFSREHPYIAIAYTPGYTFMENRNYSYAINVPLRVGYANYYYSVTYGNGEVTDNWKSYIVQLPLMFNFNYGAGSTQKARGRVGFFGGAGYAVEYRKYKETYKSSFDGSKISSDTTQYSTGIAFNGGIRFAVGRSYRRKNIELGLAYIVGITGDSHNLFNFHVLFNF